MLSDWCSHCLIAVRAVGLQSASVFTCRRYEASRQTMAGSHHPHGSCGVTEMLIFVFALLGGTCCSLTSKIMFSLQGTGMTGEIELFSYPIFQTFGMFLGMLGALPIHFFVEKCSIPFPGYSPAQKTNASNEGTTLDDISATDSEKSEKKSIPWYMYLLLIFPSLFDLTATALCLAGLQYVNVSIYQMLRGSAIVFVALLKQFALNHHLHRFKWIGIVYNVLSIVFVGLTALLSSGGASISTTKDSTDAAAATENAVLGVMLILCGAFVQSLQVRWTDSAYNYHSLFEAGNDNIYLCWFCSMYLKSVS